MEKPEDSEQNEISACSQSAGPGVEPCSKQRPGCTIAGRVIKDFDERECDEYYQNQAKDNKAIPWSMQKTGQLLGTDHTSPESKDEQGNRNENDKSIKRGRKSMIIAEEWKREVKASQNEIKKPNLDENE